MEGQALIEIQDVTKTYRMGDIEVGGLRVVSLRVQPGEMMAIMGIAIVFVTHEPDIAGHTRRIVRLQDGLVVSDVPVAHPRQAMIRPQALRKSPANGHGRVAPQQVEPGFSALFYSP